MPIPAPKKLPFLLQVHAQLSDSSLPKENSPLPCSESPPPAETQWQKSLECREAYGFV